MDGYAGKILHVDLTNNKLWDEEPPESFYRRYLGANGFVGYYLLNEMPKGADALGPDNVLVFAAGRSAAELGEQFRQTLHDRGGIRTESEFVGSVVDRLVGYLVYPDAEAEFPQGVIQRLLRYEKNHQVRRIGIVGGITESPAGGFEKMVDPDVLTEIRRL